MALERRWIGLEQLDVSARSSEPVAQVLLQLDLLSGGLVIAARRRVEADERRDELDELGLAAADLGDDLVFELRKTHAGVYVAAASRMARQTRSPFAGMSTCRTPNGASASTTAFCTAGVAPIVPDSPIPFAPEGVDRRRRLHLDDVERGQLRRRRERVVDEVAVIRLASSS